MWELRSPRDAGSRIREVVERKRVCDGRASQVCSMWWRRVAVVPPVLGRYSMVTSPVNEPLRVLREGVVDEELNAVSFE